MDRVPWLTARYPAAPQGLIDAMMEQLPSGAPSGATEYRRSVQTSIAEAIAVPGRHRPSAFHVLAGDALLTLACEVALSGEEPRQILQELLEVGGAR